MTHLAWFLLIVNEVCLVAVMISAMAVYFRRPPPTCLRQHLTHLSLILIGVGCFGKLLDPIYTHYVPTWWTVALHLGMAVIALRQVAYALWGAPPIDSGRHPIEP